MDARKNLSGRLSIALHRPRCPLPVGRRDFLPFARDGQAFLRNGFYGAPSPRPQLLETQQHRQHPLEFAVQMDLVSAEAIQLVEVEGLTKGMLPNERPVRQFLLAVVEPRQHLVFEEAPQCLDIGAPVVSFGVAPFPSCSLSSAELSPAP
jgi:hypothetical protein